MWDHCEVKLTRDGDGLWHAYRRPVASPDRPTLPLLVGTGATLRDAMDELALQLERERQEHGNAPQG